MNTFSVPGAFSAGWDIFTKRPWFLIGSGFLVTIAYFLIVAALGEFGRLGFALAFLGALANIAVQNVYKMGVTNLLLKAYDRVDTVKLEDYWHPHPFWNFFLANLAVVGCVIAALIGSGAVAGIFAGIAYLISHVAAFPVFIGVGALLMIVSLVYIVLTFSFVPYIVIARSLQPIESLKESARISKHHRLQILGFVIVALLINLLGVICLVVGLAVSIPVTSLALVHMYHAFEQSASEPMVA